MKVRIEDTCTSCGLCVDTCPEVFDLGSDMAEVIIDEVPAESEEAAQQAADEPAATGGHNGADPQADAASGDVLSQISRLSPKAAEAIAAALGDGEAQ